MRLQNVLIGIVNIVLEIKANTWSCLELKKKMLLSKEMCWMEAVRVKSCSTWSWSSSVSHRGSFRIKLDMLVSSPQFQSKKHDTNIGICRDQCGSCNTHQHGLEVGTHWFLNWVVEAASAVYTCSNQNFCLYCYEAFPPTLHFVQSFERNSLISWEFEIWTHPFRPFGYSSLSG